MLLLNLLSCPESTGNCQFQSWLSPLMGILDHGGGGGWDCFGTAPERRLRTSWPTGCLMSIIETPSRIF